MTIAVGSLVYVKIMFFDYDELCVILSEPRPEFIGVTNDHFYYEVYSFETRKRFLAFDYEMTLFGSDGPMPYFVKG